MNPAARLDVLWRKHIDDGELHAYPAAQVKNHNAFYLHPVGHVETHRRPHVLAEPTSTRMCPNCAQATREPP